MYLRLSLEFSSLPKRHFKKYLQYGSSMAGHPRPCVTKNIFLVHCHSNDNLVRYQILSSKFFLQYLNHIISLCFCLWCCCSEIWYQSDSFLCSGSLLFLWKLLKCSLFVFDVLKIWYGISRDGGFLPFPIYTLSIIFIWGPFLILGNVNLLLIKYILFPTYFHLLLGLLLSGY